MSFSIVLSPPPTLSPSFPRTQQQHQLPNSLNLVSDKFTLQFLSFGTRHRLQASRRISNFPQGIDNLVDDPRSWSRSIDRRDDGEYDDEEDDDDDDDDDEEDRSLDLLVRFVQNIFKKISKRARRAVRSVLPISISAKLVGFSVNGVLILAFLWIMKAFLEVVCTLSSVVFVSILLIRGVWTGVTHLQENRNLKVNEFDDQNTWTGAQPAT
ncbi:hypothetical protein FEM48_Zijuj09G0140500 [Ziziphus jujuba var. spinosa]|uniref:Protein SHORT HYPOCOTYL IN WHITE LIGHT 1 n=1 Tax=Ziziphus jujuba var. spinosa TaxID=714518 RepID=A0A978UTE3_ZIZJJ|nr:hypothetical protein FEM48_Zijuj09G0140500 [Ziziphus jujuba var. spinosa]